MDVRVCATDDCQRPAGRRRPYCGRCRHARWPGDPERAKARQRAKTHLRKAAGRQSDITLEYEQELRRKATRCPLCRVRMTSKPYLPASKELDHIVPLNVGGTHTVGNVRIACRTCNQARPRDGSDYAGPVTLWAQTPGFVPAVRQPSGPRPQRCQCGAFKRRGRCLTCHPLKVRHRTEDGRRAAELRAQGWKWTDIARTIGFSSGGSCQGAAMAHGLPEVKAAWPSRYVHGGQRQGQRTLALIPDAMVRCIDCKDPVVPNTERCAECWVEVQDTVTDGYLKEDVIGQPIRT
jgi:hypothetical protein